MYKPNSVLFSYSRVAKERSLYCQATGVPKHFKYLVCENKDFSISAGKSIESINAEHYSFGVQRFSSDLSETSKRH